MKQIVLATHNKGKIREFKAALAEVGYQAIGIGELQEIEEPLEDGKSFEENALIKAHYYMNACDLPCLADDSGLEVDALNGAPGIYSARYAGEACDDEANNRKLLNALREIPFEERTARYICALALVYPDGKEITVSGHCEGLIQDERVGMGGFGYDPYFYLPEYETTIANISMAEKNKISHRGLAVKKLIAYLGGVK